MTDRATYLLVGAGGTGSVLAEPLLAWLISQHGDDGFILGILDGDKVEKGNLARQLFRPQDIEAPKASALAAKLNHPSVIGKSDWLTDENVATYIQEGDTVIIAADNYAVRKRINEHAKTLNNCRVINAGNEESHGSLQDYIRIAGADYTPPLDFMHPEIAEGKGVDPAELSCTELAALPGGGQTLAANFMSAAWVLSRLGNHDAPVAARHEIHWDLHTVATKAYKPADFGWQET